MPITYCIDGDSGIIYWSVTGQTAWEDWIDVLSRFQNDPDRKKGNNILIDSRRHETVMTAESVKDLIPYARRFDNELNGPKWAIVTNRDVAYGLARMFSTLCELEGIQVVVFRDMDEAQSWIQHNELVGET